MEPFLARRPEATRRGKSKEDEMAPTAGERAAIGAPMALRIEGRNGLLKGLKGLKGLRATCMWF